MKEHFSTSLAASFEERHNPQSTMELTHRCPVCGNFDLPEFYEPRGYAVCLRCETILRRLRDRLVPLYKVEPDWINLDTSLIDDLDVDSLDIVELVMAIEEEYGIKISDEEAKKIRTVKDVVR